MPNKKPIVYVNGELNGNIAVKLGALSIVEFNKDLIILEHGGHINQTIVKYMNETSKHFGLDFHVSIQNGEMYGCYKNTYNLAFLNDGILHLRRY
jgi:hypothetical protein